MVSQRKGYQKPSNKIPAKLMNNNMKALKVGSLRRSPRSFLRSKL